jgi:hypothetical protein
MGEMKNALPIIYFQIGSLLLLIGGVILAQCLFPIAAFIVLVQQHVMQRGAISALCYPLIYAVCNALFLPAGNWRRFRFWPLVGVFDCVGRSRGGRRAFFSFLVESLEDVSIGLSFGSNCPLLSCNATVPRRSAHAKKVNTSCCKLVS